MSLSPHEYIHHILDEIDYILTQISDADYESFVRNPTLKRAFVRSLEIIGEASKKLPEINPKHWDSRKAGSKLFMKSDLQEIP